MPHYELLAAQERLPGRPFTDPGRTLADARVMGRMLQRLRLEARSWPGRRTSVELLEHTLAGCRHWLVVPSTPALRDAQDVTVVGFFGDLRGGMDHSAVYDLEADVVARLGRYAPAGLLSYYDAEIACGLHGNLVLFGTPEVPCEWHGDIVHARAVALAPSHYRCLRLGASSAARCSAMAIWSSSEHGTSTSGGSLPGAACAGLSRGNLISCNGTCGWTIRSGRLHHLRVDVGLRMPELDRHRPRRAGPRGRLGR